MIRLKALTRTVGNGRAFSASFRSPLKRVLSAVAWASMTSVGVTSGVSLLAASPISPNIELEKEVPPS